MRLASDYDLILEVCAASGAGLARTPVRQLEHYAEDTRFSGICAGQLPPACVAPGAQLRPIWRQAGADPALLGFTVEICCDCTGYTHTFAKSYGLKSLQRQIGDAIKSRSDSGDIQLDMLQTHLYAFRKAPEATPGKKLQSASEVLPLPLVPRPLAAVIPETVAADVAASPFSVLVAAHLLQDIRQETLRSLGTEQAGMLLGQLHQDPDQQRVFLHIAAQVLAETQVQREAAAFHFRPETFLEAQRLIDLRGQGEIVVGWWHSHAWCRACPYVPDCQVSTLFFSDQDCQVHAAAFGQPYMVALVVGKAAHKPMREPQVQMYGWHDTAIAARDFHCLTRVA
jgi:hypothetical protein